ncbi:MAG: hypothetical protein KDE45_25255, partial [Caldilineaceae bacterium]|nr:hypothetical protein [Caldilineaceae bacterium]
MPPTPATQRLWSECPPLPPGHKLPDASNGGAGYKLLALESTGAALNVYRGYDLATRRRCPTCGNHQPLTAQRCLCCESDLREVNAGPAAVIVYESCDPNRLAAFQRMAQSQVRHAHLLLPTGGQQAAALAGDLRYYLMMPENPAPALASLPRPQSLLTVLRWGVQLAQALAALHDAGLVHGQIGEQTILIREDWTWLACAPALQPSAVGPDAASDVRDLARLLLVLLGEENQPAGLMTLPSPVRDALIPALSGALAVGDAAPVLADALAQAAVSLSADNDNRAATGWASHPGRRRSGNEDSLMVLTMDVSCAGVRTPQGVYLLADGAGGHAGGEIASQMAVQSIASFLAAHLTPLAAAG